MDLRCYQSVTKVLPMLPALKVSLEGTAVKVLILNELKKKGYTRSPFKSLICMGLRVATVGRCGRLGRRPMTWLVLAVASGALENDRPIGPAVRKARQ